MRRKTKLDVIDLPHLLSPRISDGLYTQLHIAELEVIDLG